jgi:uncharacterized membrane protein
MCIEGVSNAGCMPFKDGCLMTAQVLSIIALALSFFSGWWWVMLILGLPCFVLLQIAWCCALNKCGFITGGVLGLVGAGVTLVFGIISLIAVIEYVDYCDSYSYSYYNDNYTYNCYDDSVESVLYTWMILSFIATALWMVVGIMTLCFACGDRYQNLENQLKEASPAPAAAQGAPVPVQATKSAVPVAAHQAPVVATPAPPATTTTVTHLPDGSIEKKTEVTNPDGSKTVTVTIERAEDGPEPAP